MPEPPEAKGVRLKDGTVIKYLYGGPGGGEYEKRIPIYTYRF